MENIRYLLYPLSQAYPIAFGFKLNYKNITYFTGGSGYVMSKAALVKVVEEQILKEGSCRRGDLGHEDIHVGMLNSDF